MITTNLLITKCINEVVKLVGIVKRNFREKLNNQCINLASNSIFTKLHEEYNSNVKSWIVF